MENFSAIFYDFWQSYGVVGAVAVALVIITFITELYYYTRVYASVAGFRLSQQRTKRVATEPAVSVVVPIFNENHDYLEEGLAALLTQDCDRYEVVAVYVGNDEGFYDDLARLGKVYRHLKTTQIAFNPRYPISTKMALNVGIKSASNEHVIITTTDALPASRRWVALMAKAFTYSDIVLGYCGIEQRRGLRNRLFREYRMATSVAWLAAAIRRHPYGASRHNMGFTKSLYFGVRGFNHLNMNVGEDDLFVQRIASADNVAVVLSPKAVCTEKQWGGWSWWINRMRYFGATHRFYPASAKAFVATELWARTLFFASAVTTIVLLPNSLRITAAVLVVVRYLVVEFTTLRLSRRLGERNIAGWHFVFDITEPLIRLFTRVMLCKRNARAWR